MCYHRDVKDTDIQTLERRLMQTMDMIISKKKRSVSHVTSRLCTVNTMYNYILLHTVFTWLNAAVFIILV